MKILKRLYKWTLIIVAIQISILLFLNYVYFGSSGTIHINPEKKPTSTVATAAKTTVTIPPTAKDVKVSFNGQYLAYNLDGSLEIYSIATKKAVLSLNTENSPGLSYFEWLHDRNIIVYSFEAVPGKPGTVMVSTYNVTDGTTHNYGMEEPGTYIISGFAEGTRAVDFELSPLTNVLYVKLMYNENVVSIARYDIQDNLSYIVWNSTENVFKCTYLNDNLMYFSPDGRLNIRNGVYGSYKYMVFPENSVLLGSTYDDTVFVGEKNADGKVFKLSTFVIDAGNIQEPVTVNIPMAVNPEDVVFYYSGHLYLVDRTDSKVYDSLNNKTINFENEFVDITQANIVTKSGSEITLEKL